MQIKKKTVLENFIKTLVENRSVGYGDVTPSSVLGKIVSTIFAFLGIICVALLTANIIEINSEYEKNL